MIDYDELEKEWKKYESNYAPSGVSENLAFKHAWMASKRTQSEPTTQQVIQALLAYDECMAECDGKCRTADHIKAMLLALQAALK